MTLSNGIDQRIEVERRQIGIFGFDEDNIGCVIPSKVDFEWIGIVQVRESNAIFGANGLTDDDLVDIVEFIPIFVTIEQKRRAMNGGRRDERNLLRIDVFDEWLELGPTGNGDIQCLGREE